MTISEEDGAAARQSANGRPAFLPFDGGKTGTCHHTMQMHEKFRIQCLGTANAKESWWVRLTAGSKPIAALQRGLVIDPAQAKALKRPDAFDTGAQFVIDDDVARLSAFSAGLRCRNSA